MSFVDEVYSLYRDQLGDQEQDAVNIVLSILKTQTREHMMKLMSQMDDNEILQMIGVYLVEMIRVKMIQDGKIPQSQPRVTFHHFH